MSAAPGLRRRLLLPGAITLAAPVGQAQTRYPIRPVIIILPFAAGGPTDLIARILTEPLSRDLGQLVVVENVSSADGTIGAERVAQAMPASTVAITDPAGFVEITCPVTN